MHITFVIEVDVERSDGKFVSRDDIAQEILSELEGANPNSVYVDDSTYDVTDWTVEEQEPPKRTNRRPRINLELLPRELEMLDWGLQDAAQKVAMHPPKHLGLTKGDTNIFGTMMGKVRALTNER